MEVSKDEYAIINVYQKLSGKKVDFELVEGKAEIIVKEEVNENRKQNPT